MEQDEPVNSDTKENGFLGNDAVSSIAQSSAIAISDATDNLRNLNTLSTTAIGVALSRLIETGDFKYADMLPKAQSVVSDGANNFELVSNKVKKLFTS